jgi:uncharacterized protein YbjT (DUF2867 family)
MKIENVGTGASRRLVLISGATGYVGGRLLRAMEERGERVRCLARRPEALVTQVGPGTDVVGGDACTGQGLAKAFSGVDTAFYFIHSMDAEGGFEERDRLAAVNFGAAARAAGVKRIVYLGGLADEDHELSPHLRSRMEVGRLLRASGVPVIELRASIVIGAGSLSFEMIRALVEHLPVLVTPRWVSVAAQPIGIDDLVAYLIESVGLDPSANPVYEIGGANRVSYGDLMREYARQRGLRRWMVRVPVLTPRLSSLWLALVTPLYARVGRKLIDRWSPVTCALPSRGRSMRRTSIVANWWILERLGFRSTATGPSSPFAALAVKMAGIDSTRFGSCAACSTRWSAAWACAVVGATPTDLPWATPWTAGALSVSSPTVGCVWPRRCGCRAAPGSSSR